jgi:MFS transporter, DHA2 family, multidrug resistance protein
VKLSVFAGVAVAQKLHSPALLESVRGSFVQGMDAALFVSACIAALATLLAVIFLPGRTRIAAPKEAITAQRVA